LEDEQAEPRGSEPRQFQDPLHIAPASKDPNTSYQWFRATAERDWPWRDPAEHGWVAVAREAMGDEPSDSNEFIQRQEVRLYCRPQNLTDAAITRELATATAHWQDVESRRRGQVPFAQVQSYAPLAQHGDPLSPRPPRHWRGSHRRGWIIMVHAENLHCRLQWLGRFIERHRLAFARCRILFLSRDEAQQADRDSIPHALWAWCKRDLAREHAFKEP
jgi:hypothetical protein